MSAIEDRISELTEEEQELLKGVIEDCRRREKELDKVTEAREKLEESGAGVKEALALLNKVCGIWREATNYLYINTVSKSRTKN